MDLTNLLVSLAGGGVAGNILGALMKGRNMGPLWNTILGAVGGLLGEQVLGGQTTGMGSTLGWSAIGGVLVTLIGSFLKKRSVARA